MCNRPWGRGTVGAVRKGALRSDRAESKGMGRGVREKTRPRAERRPKQGPTQGWAAGKEGLKVPLKGLPKLETKINL